MAMREVGTKAGFTVFEQDERYYVRVEDLLASWGSAGQRDLLYMLKEDALEQDRDVREVLK